MIFSNKFLRLKISLLKKHKICTRAEIKKTKNFEACNMLYTLHHIIHTIKVIRNKKH